MAAGQFAISIIKPNSEAILQISDHKISKLSVWMFSQ